MRLAWLAACFAVVLAHAAEPAKAPAAPPAPALKNPGFENAARAGERCPEHWECSMHADPDSFSFKLQPGEAAGGKQSVCVERVTAEPWATMTQAVRDPSLRGARLRFSIALRADRIEGDGAGPWVIVHGPTGNLAHEERLVKSTRGWERLAVEFTVGPTAQLVEVGAILQGGGRACIDDARLEVVPGSTVPPTSKERKQ